VCSSATWMRSSWPRPSRSGGTRRGWAWRGSHGGGFGAAGEEQPVTARWAAVRPWRYELFAFMLLERHSFWVRDSFFVGDPK